MLKFDIKDVYSWSNAKEAKQYINKEGYFSDDLDELNREINENKLYPLKEVNSNSAICFVALSPVGRWSCGLFLPASKVKEVEKAKKWRAFKNLSEFADTLYLDKLIGTEIGFRYKDDHTISGQAIITRIEFHSTNGIVITLGGQSWGISRLFQELEWIDKDGNWQPFGVEE